MKLIKKLRVRFGEIDDAGIVYYPRFFHYYHQLFEDFFYDYLKLEYHQVIHKEKYGLPCVDIQASFKKPLAYGADCYIQLEIEKVGKKSIVWKYQILLTEGETQEVAAEAKITTVGVHMDTFSGREIPESFRKHFEAFQQKEGVVEI